MDIDWHQIVFIQRLVEISISSFCLLVTFYFTYRFHKLVIFNVNFRIVLIATHLVIAITAVLHPIIHFVPSHWYSVSDGHFLGALVFYTITFIQNVNVYFVDLKLLIIGIERRLAFKNRQNGDAGKLTGVRILIWTFAVTAFVVAFKNIIAFLIYRNLPLNERLLLTFNFDIWAPGAFLAILLAYASYFYGCYEFKRLNKYVRESYYRFETLTESYEIKQIDLVLRVIRPLLFAYGVIVVILTSLVCVMMYFHFAKFIQLGVGITTICGSLIYSSFCLYNLVTILYMCWHFYPLRIAILNDIQCLCGLRLNSACVNPLQINEKRNEQDKHFEQLHLYWDCANPSFWSGY
ncbi:hypothetical protein M3Y96_00616400 [Aphelenchoides besseyi]|nr:hypothetical protein M3Y96_00616400 [Aphelenchoides besseyi]